MPATSPDDIIDLLSRIREQANQHICDELARRGIPICCPPTGPCSMPCSRNPPSP